MFEKEVPPGSAGELVGLVVFVPMYEGDNVVMAENQAKNLSDQRVWHSWDPDAYIGGLVAQTLGLSSTAWDVYMIYGHDAVWDDRQPPEPVFWMHQLSEARITHPELMLDRDRFKAETVHIMSAGRSQGDR